MKTKKNKYNAVPVIDDGFRFDSTLEHKRYLQLKRLQEDGVVKFFLRQVPFHLTGGVKYKCDFQIFWTNGSITFEDVKGMVTPSFIRQKKQTEAQYPVEVNIILKDNIKYV